MYVGMMRVSGKEKTGGRGPLPCCDLDEIFVRIQQKARDSVHKLFLAVAGPATAGWCPAVPASQGGRGTPPSGGVSTPALLA